MAESKIPQQESAMNLTDARPEAYKHGGFFKDATWKEVLIGLSRRPRSELHAELF
jgi:hypothetical protein